MKKFFRVAFIVVLSLLVLGSLVACSGGEEGVKGITVRFSTGFADVVVADLVIDGTSPAVMPKDPVKIGYDFIGWYYDEAHTTPFVIGEEPVYLTEDLTLYAYWEKLGGGGTVGPGQETETEGGFLFEKWGEEYAVIGYDGDETVIVVPNLYKSVPVVGISAGAFVDKQFAKITIGAYVKTIEEGAFRGQRSLTEIAVNYQNTHFTVENGVLYTVNKTSLVAVPQAARLTALSLPKETLGIAEYALEGSVVDLTFAADGVYTEIDSYDFAGFAGTVTISKKITAIRRHAFDGATCQVDFAADCVLSSVEMQSFAGYKGQTLVLPGTITNIQSYAFAGCTATVDVSKLGLTTIGEHVFGHYFGKKLVVPATVSTIERYAFDGATCEITFAFGSQYVAVGDYAFAEFGTAIKYAGDETATRLGKVTFPSTVTEVSGTAFYRSYADVTFEGKRSDVTIPEELERFQGTIRYQNG